MKISSPLPQRKTRLEIIPLIDVMFFLLASFMMVSLTMTKQQTVSVNLPAATTAGRDFKPDMLNIGVNLAGDIFLDKEQLAVPELQRRLAARFQVQPDTPVYISGDAEARHADMIRALDEVRRAGFTRVAFNVRPESPVP